MSNRKILISGGTGLVGHALTELLFAKGHDVVHLSRTPDPRSKAKAFEWHPEKNFIDESAFENVTDVVHLAGEGIAEKRWTKHRKDELIYSRIKTSELLFSVIDKYKINIKSFTGASAIGYYGAVTNEKIYNEDDKPADDFLGTCCRVWETSYNPITDAGIRTTVVRTAMALSPDGGALAKLIPPVRKGVGAPLGSGKQFMPWIHINDLAGIYCKAIEDPAMSGPYNAAAPSFVTNEEFTKELAARLNKKLFPLNIPPFVMKLVFGELADMLLEGSRVSSQKIRNSGYTFQFMELDLALKDLIKK